MFENISQIVLDVLILILLHLFSGLDFDIVLKSLTAIIILITATCRLYLIVKNITKKNDKDR